MDFKELYDNGGETIDRYSASFTGMDQVLFMSHNPSSPQGVCMWGQNYSNSLRGKRIKMEDAPVEVRKAIQKAIDYVEMDEVMFEKQTQVMIREVESARKLVEKAKGMIDSVMHTVGGRAEREYEVYGRFGFDRLLEEGNPNDKGLNAILTMIKER